MGSSTGFRCSTRGSRDWDGDWGHSTTYQREASYVRILDVSIRSKALKRYAHSVVHTVIHKFLILWLVQFTWNNFMQQIYEHIILIWTKNIATWKFLSTLECVLVCYYFFNYFVLESHHSRRWVLCRFGLHWWVNFPFHIPVSLLKQFHVSILENVFTIIYAEMSSRIIMSSIFCNPSNSFHSQSPFQRW